MMMIAHPYMLLSFWQGSLLWGNTFPMLGVSGTINSLAWSASSAATLGSGGTLFFSVSTGSATEILKYRIQFYARDYSYDLRAADPVLVATECSQVFFHHILDMAVGGDGHLYVIVGDDNHADDLGPLFLCDGSRPAFRSYNYDNNTAAAYNNATGKSSMRRGLLSAKHLLILVSGDGGWWLQVDLINRVCTPRLSSAAAVAFLPYDEGKGALVLYDGSSGSWTTFYDAAICPIDTVSYLSSGGCTPLQCVRDAPCGAHSFRAVGSAVCLCEPGYFLSGTCLPCIEGPYYCPGGSLLPLRCMDNSLVVSALASTEADCVCGAGFYLFGGTCFPCPTNQWCPYNGTANPIPCYAGGITIGSGMSSPLSCVCPPRTFGITCLPCADNMDCSVPTTTPPLLFATAVQAWGPLVATDLLMSQCLLFMANADDMLLYTVDMLQTNSLTNADAVRGDGRFAWRWILVSSAIAPSSYSNLSDCMSRYGLGNLVVRPFTVGGSSSSSTRLATEVIQPALCPVFQEWNGLSEGASSCTCIAGYEFISTSLWGPRQCFACLNGTVRPKGSANGCTASCGTNEEAPYMGMSACICVRGYSRVGGGACVLDDNNNGGGEPWWNTLSVMLVFGLALGCGFLSFVCCFMILGHY